MNATTDNSQQTNQPTQQPVTTNNLFAPPADNEQPPANDPQADIDEFGYKKDEPPADEPPKDEPSKDEPPADEPPAERLTGYDDEPPKDEPPADEPPKDEPPADDQKALKESLSASLGNLPDGYDTEKILKFALDNKMTKEQIDAYVLFEQNQNKEMLDRIEQQKTEQRNKWHKELYDDPTFGGESGAEFKANQVKVDKVLEKHFPEWKKALTDRGGMLPPYIMKDLLGLHKTLNPKTDFNPGEPSTTPQPEEGTQEDFLQEAYK